MFDRSLWHPRPLALAILGGLNVASQAQAACVSLATLGSTYSENFNALATTGTVALTLNGWSMLETGTNANATYTAGSGSSTTGNTYSFGASGSSDRALGGLQSGSLVPTVGACFTNNTGLSITSLNVAYTGEEWRLGATGRGADKINFQYSTNATALNNGTWTSVASLDFATPVTTTAGAKDGNASANRTAKSANISSLNIANGMTFWIRWNDFNATSSDDGLAVDDFSLTPNGVGGGTTPSLSVNDVFANESNSGTRNFTFTVSLSAPATVPVTFDIATNDGTATAGSDYIANALAGQIIPVGSTSYSFSVAVIGDIAIESDETFKVNVSNVSGATVTNSQGTGTIVNDDALAVSCPGTSTPIGSIQGSAASAALTGTRTVQGVVIGDYEGATTTNIGGFYLQNRPSESDADPNTSDAIFVTSTGASQVSLGQVVQVTGTVSESNNQTRITSTTVTSCGGNDTITPTNVNLPVPAAVAGVDYLERFEGMLVNFNQTLYITEHYQAGRFGQVTMSGTARLPQPTNIALPGPDALTQQAVNDLNRITVDDELQTQNPDPIKFGRNGATLTASNTLRGGDTVSNLVGVLTQTDATSAVTTDPILYRIRPIGALGGGSPNFQAANARPSVPAVVPGTGTLKVASANLLNFFNTFGLQNCTGGVSGPQLDCRGAENQTEFERQWPKTVENLVGTGAAVIVVNEMENDGYGSTSAIQFLVDKLNAKAGASTYAFINPDIANGTDSMGSDAIKVAILYKPGIVTPVGITAPLNSTAFVTGGDSFDRNRPALAQAFQENSTARRFIVVGNHLKSKGSACDAPDLGDGQGNCSTVRTNAANTLMSWLATNPTGTGDPDLLIVGDLNSYAKEDPVAAIKAGPDHIAATTADNYVNLIETLVGADGYSYVFDGQWGYLDHALASPTMATQMQGVLEWHINSDEPSVLDYNTNFKSAGQLASLYAVDAFRTSDHDPIVLSITLSQ